MIWEIDDAPKAVEGLDENGRPDPAYAAALGLRTAPFGRRVLATVLELALALLLALPGMLVLVPIALDAVSGALDLDALVDTAACAESIGDMSDILDRAGKEQGLSIRIQREDIFNAMHRI